MRRGVGACGQVGDRTTHNKGASRAEGKGPTAIEVRGVKRDQDTDEVEALRLTALLLKGTFTLFSLTSWPGYHVPQPWDSWILDIQSQDGLSGPHIESVAIAAQEQRVEVSEAFLLEEAEGPVPISCMVFYSGHGPLPTSPGSRWQ